MIRSAVGVFLRFDSGGLGMAMLYFLTVWTGLLGVCLAIGFRVLSGVAPDIASGAASGVSSDIVLDADRGLRLGDRAIVAAWLGLVLLSISLLLVAIAL
ncbi:MAG: hypothetical protein AAFZ17_04300, partial [Cyanobacteria bacterium J06650_10]